LDYAQQCLLYAFKFRVFSDAGQVFDEILKEVLSRFLAD